MKYKIGGALGLLALSGCSSFSSAQIDDAKKKCVDFYNEERARSGSTVEALDTWTKEGKLVVEIAERDSPSDTSYHSSVCVVDVTNGKLQLPSMLDQSRWEK